MDELLNEKAELKKELELIRSKITELENYLIPDDIDILTNKIRNNRNKSTKISESLEKIDEINIIDDTTNSVEKVIFAKKIYSIVDTEKKEDIINELEEEGIDKLNIFDDVLKFFDINFNGTDLKNTPDMTHIFNTLTVTDIKNDIVNKTEFSNGSNLKNKINSLVSELKALYHDTTELDKILKIKISDVKPAAIMLGSKKRYKIDNTGVVTIGTNAAYANNSTCIDAIDAFFDSIKKVSEIVPTAADQIYTSIMAINGENIKKIIRLINYIKKELEDVIPKIIETYMNKQTGGAFNPNIYKNYLLIPMYIDLFNNYVIFINDRIDEIIELEKKMNNSSSNKSKHQETKNVSETIKKYLSIAIKSKITSINNFDMLLIEYLEELNLPTHIMMSIFITPRMSTIQSIIEHNAPDKMFSLYEITRLKKASDFVRFEQNYGY